MKHIEYSWNTKDGVKIYAQAWEPDLPHKAVICLVHGLGEHTDRYHHVAEALTLAGYTLSAFDLRGHGRSAGPRGHTPDIDTILDDLETFLQLNSERYGQNPAFLYGHSLGAILVMLYGMKRTYDFKGIVATGPIFTLAFEPPKWKIPLGRLMAKLFPTFTMTNEVDVQKLSRDPKVVQDYVKDPLVHHRITTRLGVDMLDSGVWVAEHASEFPLPLLLMHGSADRLTSAPASIKFAEHAGKLCTLKIWDGFFHEIHNEPEKQEVFDYMIHWMNQRLASN